jgi:hypothetical protein
MSASNEPHRCARCGKEIEPEQKVARIAFGFSETKKRFSEKSEWGYLHVDGCFNRVIESPKSVLDELKKIDGASRKKKVA